MHLRKLAALSLCLPLFSACYLDAPDGNSLDQASEEGAGKADDGVGDEPHPLSRRPAFMTEDERERAAELELWRDFPYELTPPPEGKVTPPVEWEEQKGHFVRWPSGWDLLKPMYLELIAALQTQGRALVVVDNERVKERVIGRIDADCSACRPEDIEWIFAPTDSIWMRDYGPQFVNVRDDDEVQGGVVNLSYYPNRRRDDSFPVHYGAESDTPVYSPGLFLEGGNFQADARGRCVVSEALYGSNSDDEEAIEALEDYFGCAEVIVVPRLEGERTGHVDMWLKLLDDDKAIVGDYRYEGHDSLGSLDARNADVLDEVAAVVAEAGYEVTRIPMPPTYSHGVSDRVFPSYTNSVFANHALLVPVYGVDSDELAVGVYEELLPEHIEVIPIDASDVINYGGALHCITVEHP